MIFKERTALAEGRYELLKRIGSGGMASVWEAQDTVLGRSVAIKVPSEPIAANAKFVQRFEHEARTAAGLSHPNLVSIYDYGREDDRPYLVMEFVDGESLAERAERGAPTDAGALGAALLGALDHIHGAGIVHRDVKPGNVMIDGQGRILLTDFGIAQSGEALSLTGTGQVVGTLTYIAPEIMDGERATPRSDLYSTGIVLRDCLESGAPASLRGLVESLTAEDPGERPGSAASALATIGASRTGAMLPPEDMTGSTASIPIAPAATDPEPTPTDYGDPEPDPEPTDWDEPAGTTGPPLPPMTRTHEPAAPDPRRRSPLRFLLPAAILAVIAIVALIAISGGDSGSSGGKQVADGRSQGSSSGGDKSTSETTTEDATTGSADSASTDATDTAETSAGLPPVTDPDPARGETLNEQGYAQLQAGDYEGAVATLEQAVASYPEDSTDLNYAYALFNYAQALRLSGNPEAAIPVLKKRLTFDDQTETVQAELATAREAAAG